VAEAYRRKGYAVEETGGGGPDGGIDLVARKGGDFLVQCKHWKAYRVGVKEARELLGLVTAERAAGGILITSGGFTPDAQDFAERNSIELVNGPRLLQLVRLAQNGRSAVVTTPPPLEKALTVPQFETVLSAGDRWS
jgi:restriction system protein